MFTADDHINNGQERQFYRIEDDGEDNGLDHGGIEYINGTFWQKYEKKNKLGEGTSGLVRRCKEKSTGKEFAVKIVRTRDEEIIFHVRYTLQIVEERIQELKELET